MFLLVSLMFVGGATATCASGNEVCDDELTTLLQTVAQTQKGDPVMNARDGCVDPSGNFGYDSSSGAANRYDCTDYCLAQSDCVFAEFTDGYCDYYDNTVDPFGGDVLPSSDPACTGIDLYMKMYPANGGGSGGGSASGDPHLVNLRGEKFDVNVAGRHILLQIPKGSGKFLEVSGRVDHLPTEVLGHAPCDEFLFTEFSVRGSWVDPRGGEVTVKAGKELDLAGFAAHHTQQGDATSTSYKHMMTRKGSAVVGKAHLWACKSDEKSLDQKQLCKQLGSLIGAGHRQLKFFDHQKAMFVMSMEGFNSMPVHFGFFRFEGASPAYLNMAFDGLHHTDDVGGLLGSDDHSEVSRHVKKCTTTHHAKSRPGAQRHAEVHQRHAQAKRNHE